MRGAQRGTPRRRRVVLSQALPDHLLPGRLAQGFMLKEPSEVLTAVVWVRAWQRTGLQGAPSSGVGTVARS